MSNRPGIGAKAMDKVVELLETEFGVDLLEEGDVPLNLKIGKKLLPLGRYLSSKIREKMGWKETGCPEEVLQGLRTENIKEYLSYIEKEGTQKGQKEFLLNKNKPQGINSP